MATHDDAFQREALAVLDALESGLEALVDAGELDLDIERQGNVITLTFADDSRIVINSHDAAREIWVAARSGGFHYRRDGTRWIDGRSANELFEAVSRLVSEQSGEDVRLQAGG